MELTARNADLATFAAMLKEQRTRAVDVIVPASRLRAEGGAIRLEGVEPVMSDTGVTSVDGLYTLTRAADEQVGGKLGIHGSYMTRMRGTGRLDLWDVNVNGWLHGDGREHGPDGRKLMARTFRGDGDGPGVLRALLSDRYHRIDNLDVITAALLGVRESGADIEVQSCDLTDRHMYVKVAAPGIAAWAPALMAGYRNPFGMELRSHGWSLPQALEAARREGQAYEPGTEPVVFAGFSIRNSETGFGGFSLAPMLTVRVCGNKLTFTADAQRRVHLGGVQDEGVVDWSEDTQRKALELITLKARDAVRAFLNVEYVQQKVAELEEQAGAPVDQPAAVIKAVAKASAFPAELEDQILGMFVKGGQATCGGVMQAVSAVAATVDDAELAALLEEEAPKALALAARAAQG